jgi:hypothetical protein
VKNSFVGVVVVVVVVVVVTGHVVEMFEKFAGL